MTKLILSTGNIVSGGPSIIRKPGAYRSNLELTNSLRSNFLAAQEDSATSSPADAEPPANGVTNGGANGRPAVSRWTQRDADAWYIPRIDWQGAGLQEDPQDYDTTLKLFFLPTSSVAERGRYAREALNLVLRQLGVAQVDLLIVSFPGMSFEGDCEWEADKTNAEQGSDEEEAATWKVVEALHAEGLVKRLGIAEFGSFKLANFLKHATVAPVVDQINLKNCCNVPPPLAKLAKEHGIELLVHSDCTDILPQGTLRELLGFGARGAGVLPDAPADGHANGANGTNGASTPPLQGELLPEWVVKYTAVVRDRGVIENKGYFASAELRGH